MLFSGKVEEDDMATAFDTCGDGACSLHALWGSVISTPVGNTYYCDDARHKLLVYMLIDVTTILNSPCGAAVQVLLENIWSDVILYVMRRTRREASLPGCVLFYIVFIVIDYLFLYM